MERLELGGDRDWYMKLMERPSEVDCIYYVRLGSCGYEERCHYNHPGCDHDHVASVSAPFMSFHPFVLCCFVLFYFTGVLSAPDVLTPTMTDEPIQGDKRRRDVDLEGEALPSFHGGVLAPEQCKALESVLLPKLSSKRIYMEIDECKETTMH
ncbi:hypothetical protein ZEAMMB73_Zm00001d050038 [Zea mays]|nr:hypothetical protein ZEAMMB73_Zm00001d050038 [Zea mays]